jgi:peptidoglycan/xylan/chitin deacetylase (PgdA/CDA1 family)
MNTLRVLMYHKVDEKNGNFLCVSSAQLKEQLLYIKSKYVPIKLSDLLGHIKNGTALPDKAILITFDDGYENNFTLAYPIFETLNIPFTIFTVNGFIGKKTSHDSIEQAFLSEEQILNMVNLVDFAHHGLKHDNLMDLSPEQRTLEIIESVKQMGAFKHKTLAAWAYTYGAYPKRNKTEFDALKLAFQNSGIVCAFRIGNRINKLPLKDPYKIERIDIRGDESFFKFRLKVGFGKILQII